MPNPADVQACSSLANHRPHVCPWWLGWTLVFPARRWFLSPESWLAPLVKPGHRALEVGPGTGFFTLPLAERVGPSGKVWCVDLQPRMLTALERRLGRHGLGDRVTTRACRADDLGVSDLANSLDLAVMVYVLHEVPDPARTLAQVVATLHTGGRLLLIEPRGHCSPELWAEELRIARDLGLRLCEPPPAARSRRPQAAVLERVSKVGPEAFIG
jgi:SAM-dependent methyltransferase